MNTHTRDTRWLNAAATLLIATALILSVTGCNDTTAEGRAEKVVPVEVEKLAPEVYSVPVVTSGRLFAGTEMRLAFKIGGYVDRFMVNEGDRVRRGQRLALLQQAEIRAQADAARSALDNARRDHDRIQQLYNDSVATLEQLQDAQTGLTVAQSNSDIASFNLRHATISAPADGIVLKRLAEPNELVGAGAPVLMVASTEQAWVVKAGVADRDVVRIAAGDSAHVTIDAYDDRVLHGRVVEIAESPDPMTGTYEVEIELDATELRLLSGFSADISIFPSEMQEDVLVPMDALLEADGSRGIIFVVDSAQTARERAVVVGGLVGERVVVRSLPSDTLTVIVSGAAYVNDGVRVAMVSGSSGSTDSLTGNRSDTESR